MNDASPHTRSTSQRSLNPCIHSTCSGRGKRYQYTTDKRLCIAFAIARRSISMLLHRREKSCLLTLALK